MKYLHTMVRVSDIETSLHFYCELLGMVEVNRIENPSGRFTLIFLAADEDETAGRASKAPLLELTYNWPDQNGETENISQGARNFGHLAFVVDDIYATCTRLQAAGVTINRPPRDGHMAFVKSPDGISLELLQRGQPLPSQEPWASMSNSGNW